MKFHDLGVAVQLLRAPSYSRELDEASASRTPPFVRKRFGLFLLLLW
jgi:hypothetical protein